MNNGAKKFDFLSSLKDLRLETMIKKSILLSK